MSHGNYCCVNTIRRTVCAHFNYYLLQLPSYHMFIAQMIEKARITMQSQFDQWYANLHARNGMIGNTQSASAHSSAYADHAPASLSTSLSSDYRDAARDERDARDGSRDGGREGDRRVPQLSLDSSSRASGGGGGGGGGGRDSRAPASYSSSGSVNASHASISLGGGGGGSMSMLAADSKVTDEDVNEDIQAFYQAKEELLRRRGAKI